MTCYAITTCILIAVSVILFVLYKNSLTTVSGPGNEGHYRSYYNLSVCWLSNIIESKHIGDYLNKNHLRTIAIYGMGELGLRLYEELKKYGFQVEFFIETTADRTYTNSENVVITNIDGMKTMPRVDAIIVTPINDFIHIRKSLLNSGCTSGIISLEDIIYRM